MAKATVLIKGDLMPDQTVLISFGNGISAYFPAEIANAISVGQEIEFSNEEDYCKLAFTSQLWPTTYTKDEERVH